MEATPEKRLVFNAFNPLDPLIPGDPRYVDFREERNGSGYLSLAEAIFQQTAGSYAHQLFCGVRGSGITTELLQLKHFLQSTPDKFFVVHCQAEPYLELSDLEVADLLLAIAQDIHLHIQRAGIELSPLTLSPLWKELYNLASSHFGGIPHEDEFLQTVCASIKQDSLFRSRVREYLAPRTTALLEAINTFLQQVAQQVTQRGYAGVVMVVDNLTRLLHRNLPGAAITMEEELFLNHASLLCSLECHVLYTIPTSLFHSSASPLTHLYGSPPLLLPMIPVTTRQGERQEDSITKLKEVISKRLESAGTSLETVFDAEETANLLCESSGGLLRTLMGFVRQSVLQASSFPVTGKEAESVIQQFRGSFIVGLTQSHWERLYQVAATKQLEQDSRSSEMLSNQILLEYSDDDGLWYDVNPMVRTAFPREAALASA